MDDDHERQRRLVEGWVRDDPDPVSAGALGASDPTTAGVPLTFGTSGLRGPLGTGPATVNRVTARRLAAGVCEVLGPAPTVVVGGDARHGSAEMRGDVAAVVVAAGGRALLAATPEPTPLLTFAVRHLGADAGVVVTASHNPAGDNGLKVYGPDGIGVVPPVDRRIAGALAVPLPDRLRDALDRSEGPRPAPLPADVRDAYRRMAAALVATTSARRTRIVHTALHGVSSALATAVLHDAGFEVIPVPGQADPDPDFPSIPHPNPEDPRTLEAALALAADRGADLVLAHDPDGDRLAVAVPNPAPGPAAAGGPGARRWRVLDGNEVGSLLCDELCAASARRPGPPGVVASTFVSTALIGRIAEHHGVRHVVTPTGFKWVMRASLDPSTRFVFGFEEALGYAVTDAVRDKDGMTAALVVADLADRLGPDGLTDRLEALARRHGRHLTRAVTRALGSAGPDAADRVMATVRGHPPVALAGDPVVGVVDHRTDEIPVDLVVWSLRSGASVALRPSGTEAKLKAYLEVVDDDPTGGDRRLRELEAAVVDLLDRALAAR